MCPTPRLRFPVLSLAASLLAVGLSPGPVSAGPEHGRGNIVSVDWSSMQLVLKDPQGGKDTWKIDPGSKVKFSDVPESFPNPTVRDLAPGMYIYFIYEGMTRVIYDVDVREVPPEARKPRPTPPVTPVPEGGSSQQLKVRLESIDSRRGEFRAVVGGRTDVFRMRNPRGLDRFSPGDMAIITVENEGGERLVTAIRSAAQSGTIRSLDTRRRQITLDVDARVTTYAVSNGRLLDRLKVGDRIRFEFEDRPGMDVIIAIY